MDNKIKEKILFQAVAGSGKTRKIIEDLDLDDSIAIITYTDNNQDEIKNRIIEKYGYAPRNINVFGVFEFLYGFCLQPNCTTKLYGIIFNSRKFHKETNNVYKFRGKKLAYFFKGRVFDNMLSKLLVENKEDIEYLKRINRYFDTIYIDEIQDFASDEIDWLNTLLELDEIKIWLLGDFFQRTFDTSRRGNKGSKSKRSYEDWVKSIKGYRLDETTLIDSKRCNDEVCKFIRDNLKININSNNNSSENSICFLHNDNNIDFIMFDNSVKKLFYREHYRYNCNSDNWGNSKGCEYDNVCVVLNKKTADLFKKNRLDELPLLTKSKLYIACTRTKNKLYFVEEKLLAKYKK